MKRALTINFVLVIFLLFSFGVVLAEEAEIITAIELEGNKLISDDEIMAVIETEPGVLLNQEQLKADIQAIGKMGYFQDVRISFESYQGGLKAIYELVENPVVNEIVFEGNESFDDSTLLSLSGIQAGEILNVNKLDQAVKTITQNYQDEGYVLAKFADVNVSQEGVLNFKINEGYLNKIVINGNEKTKEFVILRKLDLTEGEVININEIRKGSNELARLNYFEDIQPRFERVEDENKPNYVNLVLDLTEANTGSARLGGGWSTKDGWFGFFDIKERNLFGNAQTLNFRWQFGGTNDYSLSFYEPWLYGSNTSFGISLYDRRSEGSDSEMGDYSEHRQGGSISLGHPLTSEWDGKITFRVEGSETDWVDDYPDEEGITRSLTLQTNRDTTNHPFNPTDGGIDTISVEYAGQYLGGDNNFTKYNLETRRYFNGFKRGHAWALRLKTGLGEGDIPWHEEYRLGGSESLRGYDPGYFSGENMLLLSAEYRLPIADNFTGVVFADSGKTWDNNEELDLEELNYSLGLGVRMNTPIGLLRLDYGFNEEGQGQPQFSIGQTF